MLVEHGSRAIFELEDGRDVRAPGGTAILHDASGRSWPASEALIAPFTKTGRTLDDPPKDAIAQLEKPREGKILLPSREGWSRVGRVVLVRYHYHGVHFAPEGHEHEFTRKPMLFRKGQLLKLGPVRLDEHGFHG